MKLAKHDKNGEMFVLFVDQNESQFQDSDDTNFETKKEKTK